MKNQSVNFAVIPVAGLGTRFLPATKAIPKELLPLGDKPVLQHIVEEAVASGIEHIIFITSPDKTAIEKHFSQDIPLEEFLLEKGKQKAHDAIQHAARLAEFIFIPQTEPLGLGHAVLQAKDVVGDKPFIVFGGDDVIESQTPVARQMIDAYDEHGSSVIGVMEVPEDAVSRYGIVDPEQEFDNNVMKISNVIEKPKQDEAPSRFAAAGRWLLTPEIFAALETTQPGAGGEVQLTDAIKSLMKEQPVFAKLYEGTYRDCGNKTEYIKAVVSYALQHDEYKDDVRAFIESFDDTFNA